MHGACFFSELDASQGYWQIPVDEDSSKVLTFSTPFGRFCFSRMPYGIHSTSEVFQIELSHITEGLKGTKNIEDDIIVWSSTLKQHYEQLRAVLSCIKEAGSTLNKLKMCFRSRRVDLHAQAS